jgi:hypothetical protein
VVVFAVWEPMLPTDWGKPSASVLQRLSDRRGRQFWDPNHLVAIELKKAEAIGKLHQDCCERKGFLWDLAAVYAPGARWREIPPEPVFLNGPVAKVPRDLETALAKLP